MDSAIDDESAEGVSALSESVLGSATEGEMKFVIWSIEHDAWWRPASCGYTRSVAEAGVYGEVEAREILTRANLVAFNECLIPVECVFAPEPSVEEHNAAELDKLRTVMRAVHEAFGSAAGQRRVSGEGQRRVSGDEEE